MLQKHMLAPGIYQQVQSQCGKCGGTGKVVKHKCKTCKGERVRRGVDSYDVSIEPGTPAGYRVTFENEADEHPDWVAGDLIVELVELAPELDEGVDEEDEEAAAASPSSASENSESGSDTSSKPKPATRTDGTFFRRKDSHLYWREVLSLREAWLGDWSRNLTHLDGHTVRLGRQEGQVVQPGAVERVAGQGMPVFHRDDGESDYDSQGDGEGKEFGDLVVEYVVVLPDQMHTGIMAEFRGLWGQWLDGVRGGEGDAGAGDKAKHDEL